MFEEEKERYLKKHGFEASCLKAVLFDMDGVLFDSMPNHAYAWSHSVSRFGLHMTPEEAYMHEGRTGGGTINLLAQRYWGRDATEEEKQAIYKAKSELFNQCPEAPQMPGAYALLKKVNADGFTPMVVTGSGQVCLIDRLEHNFPGIFRKELMVTSFDVKYGKPNPEPYLMGMQKAGIRPWEGIVVENAPLGVQAGTAANLFTIAVNTCSLPDQVLLDAGADLLFPSMQALCDNWEEVRNTFSPTASRTGNRENASSDL
ncbi:MAG: HAD hydrolase-like protein [Paraprevotella sp.]|nr:HAD hydrolase-like protein [Paraprevotella sp.]